MIDAGAEDCPIEMCIDNHTMLVISMDSNDIKPVEGTLIYQQCKKNMMYQFQSLKQRLR